MTKHLRINKKQRAERALGDKKEADKNKTRLEYMLRGFNTIPAKNKQFCPDILMLSWKDALKHIDVKVLDKLKAKGSIFFCFVTKYLYVLWCLYFKNMQ